jgi:hypothetical protein
MREHVVNKLDNFIGGWYMDDTSLCDDLMIYHRMSPNKIEGVSGTSDSKGQVTINKAIKESTDVRLNLDDALYSRYTKHLGQCLDKYIEKYPYCNGYYPFTDLEPINIQHYKPKQGFYAWHTERSGSTGLMGTRHLVFMTYLNDVTDAGETEFFHQKLKVTPEKGLTLIWGSDWTFTHRGITSPSQTKYIVTGWLNFYERE